MKLSSARGPSALAPIAEQRLDLFPAVDRKRDLAAAGYEMNVNELAAARAAQARDTGVDGLVCSAEEVASLRAIAGPSMVLVTPGIRPAGSVTGDQKRIMTPSRAIEAGADYLVVGRPILEANDPKAAADEIVTEIEKASPRRK